MPTNISEVKPAIIPVSRDCFLPRRRRSAVAEACKGNGLDSYKSRTAAKDPFV